jgi:hypothetical protein
MNVQWVRLFNGFRKPLAGASLVKKVTLTNDGIGIGAAADKSIEGCFMSGTEAGSGIALAATRARASGFSLG